MIARWNYRTSMEESVMVFLGHYKHGFSSKLLLHAYKLTVKMGLMNYDNSLVLFFCVPSYAKMKFLT